MRKGEFLTKEQHRARRDVLPIPDMQHVGLTTYDAKDPDTKFSPIPDKPFFMWFATGATRAPHHVPKQWIDKYKRKFDQGWDKLPEEIFARQKKLGMIRADGELTKRHKELPAWEDK